MEDKTTTKEILLEAQKSDFSHKDLKIAVVTGANRTDGIGYACVKNVSKELGD